VSAVARLAACAVVTLSLTLAASSVEGETVQKGSLRVSAAAKLRPHRLPRTGMAPLAVTLSSELATTDRSAPPPLRTLRIELNRRGRLDTEGLPECRSNEIQPASTARALSACRDALVGRGSFSVDVVLGGQEPYPTTGRLLIFNGSYRGRPALLGQIYVARPFANSFVIPFVRSQRKRGKYGAVLSATLPRSFTSWGHISGLRFTLGRRYVAQGERRSVITGACPAPKGFPGAVFTLARTTFRFSTGLKLGMDLTTDCTVR